MLKRQVSLEVLQFGTMPLQIGIELLPSQNFKVYSVARTCFICLTYQVSRNYIFIGCSSWLTSGAQAWSTKRARSEFCGGATSATWTVRLRHSGNMRGLHMSIAPHRRTCRSVGTSNSSGGIGQPAAITIRDRYEALPRAARVEFPAQTAANTSMRHDASTLQGRV